MGESGQVQERAAPERRAARAAAGRVRVLRHRDYLLFWVGMTVSMVGTWMQALAQSWVVVERLTQSATVLGWVNFANALPMLLFSLLGGVAADRWDKRRILFITQVAMMALAFIFAALVASGHVRLWHVLLMSALIGLAAAYDMPAFQAYYPTLVEREDLPQAVALNQASFHGSRVIGPALAGLVIGWWGASSAFVANGLSFVAVLLALWLIRTRPAAADSSARSTFGAMAEGLRFVRSDPRLQALMGLTAVSSLLIFPNGVVLMPLYARQVLDAGPQGLGILMSAGGLGALVGSLGLLMVDPEARVRRIIAGVAAVAIGTFLLGQSRELWLSVGALVILSLGMSTSMGLVATIIQQSVPDALRGRVMSVHSLMFVGVMPFAALLIPSAADLLGLARELQVAALLYAFASLFLLRRVAGAPVAEPSPAVPVP